MIVPPIFNYAISMQGILPLKNTRDSLMKKITVGDFDLKGWFYTLRWKMRDVPALRDEPFIFSRDSYVSGVKFQLSSYTQLSTRKRIKVNNTWNLFNEKLIKNKAFGGIMTTSSHWERRELRAIVADSASDMEKARTLFAYVCNHFITQGREIFSASDRSLKEIFKAGEGTVAEINLMLTAMLREEGLNADAVILSTRENGMINPYYPLTENFNYVIVRLRLGGNTYLLDATRRRRGFGRLPLECYNGYARVVSASPDSVMLLPDSLVEMKQATVFLSDNAAGDGLSGSYSKMEGYYSSQDIRTEITEKGKNTYLADVLKSYPFEVKITDMYIDSLQSNEEPVTVRYALDIPTGGGDHIYLNPMLGEGLKGNPFTAADRSYPIQMPFGMNELFVMQMDIPRGYVVEELPKQVRAELNGMDGSYEYKIASDGHSIQLRSRLILKRTFFQPDEYQSLREFFALVVKKQDEVVVIKKAGKD